MPDHPRNNDTLNAEQSVLRFLCANLAAPAAQEARSALSGYSWRSTDHAVIFEALGRLTAARADSEFREQFPAHLTRMGFPDLSYEIYFEGKIPKESEIPELVDNLRRGANPTPR